MTLTNMSGMSISVRGDFLQSSIAGQEGYLNSIHRGRVDFWSPQDKDRAISETEAKIAYCKLMMENTTEQDFDDLGCRFARTMRELGYKNDIQLNSTVINLVASHSDQHDGRHDYPAGIETTVVQIYDGNFEGELLIQFKDSLGCTTVIRRHHSDIKEVK